MGGGGVQASIPGRNIFAFAQLPVIIVFGVFHFCLSMGPSLLIERIFFPRVSRCGALPLPPSALRATRLVRHVSGGKVGL